jgi:hypothetical protein
MRAMPTSEPEHFLSEVGHEPTFFVPDRGSAGVKASLKGPTGKTTLTESGRSEGHEARTIEGKGELPAVGPRVGFTLPRFTEPGEYTMTVDDDGETYVYVITVISAQPDPTNLEARAMYEAEANTWKNAHARGTA